MPGVVEHEGRAVAAVVQRIFHFVVHVERSHRGTGEEHGEIEAFPRHGDVEIEAHVGYIALAVSQRAFVHVVDHAVTVLVLIDQVARTYRGIALAVDVDRVFGDLLPVLELADAVEAPPLVGVALAVIGTVFLP